MIESINTLIVGGGQAGLSLSYYLTQQRRPHLILEWAAQLADCWRNGRWDSFTLVTPNWHLRLPGYPYQGDQPDGFLPRDEVVKYLEGYAASFNPPIRFGVRATGIDPVEGGYRVETSEGTYLAANVVIATGTYQQPRIPAFRSVLPESIYQIHASQYRSPATLSPGAVLVVGSGQSGCQIAEELNQAGRKVFLSVGSAGRIPRRYRGRDIAYWLSKTGFFERTVDMLPSPKARFAGNPHFSGQGGGHTINLHQFAIDGVSLLGHLEGASGGTLMIAPDLHESLAKADQMEAGIVKGVDAYIAANGIDAPQETFPQLRHGYDVEPITEFDLLAADVTSIIWATGYQFDYRWINLPVLDEDGYPMTQRGVTAFPGLYFIGLHFLHSFKSGLLYGVGEDAEFVAAHIGR